MSDKDCSNCFFNDARVNTERTCCECTFPGCGLDSETDEFKWIEHPEQEIVRLKQALDVAMGALDKYTSNPEYWDKTADEWYAVHAKQAFKDIKQIGEGERE